MFHNIWQELLYRPLLNALAFLVSIVPGGDIGLSVIILTLLVKVIIYPLSQHSLENQIKLSNLSPHIKKIKDSGKSKEDQAKDTFALYKEHKTNPFSGCLVGIIQIPVIFALYLLFSKGLNFDPSLLYSFVGVPEAASTIFLGLIDLSSKSLVLAGLAGLSQYLQARFMHFAPSAGTGDGSMQESFNKSLQMQMKYIFPIVIAFIAYKFSGAVALYWITSNIFTMGQQIYASRKHLKPATT